jgi:hypothetical protein
LGSQEVGVCATHCVPGHGGRTRFVTLNTGNRHLDSCIFIERITDRKIDCFFQDPVFNTSDKAFLKNLGHTVVETPAGCEMIDQDTFFFGVHLYKPIYAMALEKHLPVIFVGTGWEVWDE